MATRLVDDYNRPDGPLGRALSGHPYLFATATAQPSILTRQAIVPANSLAWLDSGLGGADGRAEVWLGGSLVGGGLAFRVAGGGNFFALTQRAFSETYQSGTQSVYVGEEQYVIGYSTTPVEYEWRGVYTFHPDGDNYGLHTTTAWSTSGQPGFPYSLAHNHYHHPYGTDSDVITHYHSFSYAYQTGATRGGQSTPIYGTRSVYQDQPVYSTRTVYAVRLERVVSGVTTTLYNQAVSSAVSRLAAVLSGNSIAVVVNGGNTLFTTTDAALAGETRHGLVGRATEGTRGTVTRLEFTPNRGGLYVPQIMR